MNAERFRNAIPVLKEVAQINFQTIINWFNENDVDYFNMTDLDMYIIYIENNYETNDE